MHQIDYVYQAYSFICWRTQWKFAFGNEKQFEMGGIRDRSNRKRSGKWIKVTEYLKSQNATVWYECKVTCEQIIIFCACVIESVYCTLFYPSLDYDGQDFLTVPCFIKHPVLHKENNGGNDTLPLELWLCFNIICPYNVKTLLSILIWMVYNARFTWLLIYM